MFRASEVRVSGALRARQLSSPGDRAVDSAGLCPQPAERPRWVRQDWSWLTGMMTITSTMPDYDMSEALITDADLLDRVGFCIAQQPGTGASLWIMFFDPGGVQLPVLLPIDGVPESPGPGTRRRSAGSSPRR